MRIQEWGSGDPVVALHPLALESTAFAGIGEALARNGLHTLAIDLPGFGATPAPDEPLTPAVLAEPVVRLANSLGAKPLVVGMSMGGRVALEALLVAPEAFRGGVFVAPYLPWTRYRALFPAARWLDPDWADRVPLEKLWPVLERAARILDGLPAFEDDWITRSAARVVYDAACPATRHAFLSAARELALDPAFGPSGLWTRLAGIEVPTTFVWGARDWLIPRSHAERVMSVLGTSAHVDVACAAHVISGVHFRCMQAAVVDAIVTAHRNESRSDRERRTSARCLVDEARTREAGPAEPRPNTDRRRTMTNEDSVRAPAFKQLKGSDAIFLYGESDAMPMHTLGTLLIDPSDRPGGFGYEDVLRTLRERIHLIPPFRRRLLEIPLDLGHPILVDDPDFAVENHVRRIGVPSPGGLRELALVAGMIAEHPLERTKPLFEIWVVEGLADGRVALVTKLHHCVMDGASGSAQMAKLLDLEPDTRAPEAEAWDPAPLPSAFELARRHAFDRVLPPLRALRIGADVIRGLFGRLRAEDRIEQQRGERAGWFGPRTPFNRSLTPHRSVAYGSVRLEDIVRVKRAFGVTVNDVVLAACSLAVRDYLQRRDALPDSPLQCSIPVSLKTASEREEFSNKVTAVTIALPTHLDDVAEILTTIHDGTRNAKSVLGAVEGDIIPELLDLLPGFVSQLTLRAVSASGLLDVMPPMFNLLVSNVMGPPVPLYFGGARVDAIFPMGPVGEGMGLNITVLSNMGRLDVGIMACTEAVSEPWEIAEAFERATRELVVAAEKHEAVAAATPNSAQ